MTKQTFHQFSDSNPNAALELIDFVTINLPVSHAPYNADLDLMPAFQWGAMRAKSLAGQRRVAARAKALLDAGQKWQARELVDALLLEQDSIRTTLEFRKVAKLGF